MSRTARVLEVLGLAPLWVRRERLAELQAAQLQAEAANEPAQPEARVERESAAPVADAPAPVERPASQRPAPPTVVVPSPASRAAQEPQQIVQPADARSARIAGLDWDALQAEVAECTACNLCHSRTQTVFGVGNPQAEILIVGEAPGAEEDKRGEPFVGAAGKLLDNMLTAISEKRGERVFIANVLKCRPPGNRNPTVEEVAKCAPLLQRQIELIKPKVIFASGRFAIQTLLETDAPVGALRGKVHQYKSIPVVVSYHPAYLLRNLPDKAKAWRDLLLLKATFKQQG
ncbi:uracil-DNA glycosylase [Andreprevotia chitinilytica]|uniref:uracil-DNA glycosylase n=1 Tax=Andreprevotia chitinilytica TaxID=396808 RepID=UPI000552B9A4|nr:uracil-DNA glycosylase [Andreprevotia chitinilytica]